MAGASSKEQWKLVDDQFLDSQGAINDIRCWVTTYVEELSLKRNLASDTAAWILHSMDTREFAYHFVVDDRYRLSVLVFSNIVPFL